MANYFSLTPDRVIEVTKEFTFDSAHKLDKDDGKCAYLHGHTYRLFVSVAKSNGYISES
jgi:6-pyruvoyltetrahydropterin/6-carboxytetrahydropterin synthase